MGSSPATTPEAGTRPRQDAPRDSLFASSHPGPMRTSLIFPKRMPAHSEQGLGNKKPLFVQAATPSSPTPHGWEPGLRRCPSALPCGSPRRPGGCQSALAGLAGHGAAQPLADSPQSLSLMLSRRAGPSGTALSWIPLATMFSSKHCCQTTVSGAMSPRSCRAPATPVIGVGWRGQKRRVGDGDPRAEGT